VGKAQPGITVYRHCIDAYVGGEAGDFSAVGVPITDPFTSCFYPNNQIPASELGSPSAMISKKLEAYMPAANLSGIQNNLQSSFPNNIVITQTLDRVDENIGDKDRLYFRYHWQTLRSTAALIFPPTRRSGPRTRETTLLVTRISSGQTGE